MIPYREPFVLVLPQQLLEDGRLNFVDKALWAFMAQKKALRDPTINELAAFFCVTTRYIKKIRTKLSRLGYLRPYTDRHGVTSYVLMDPALSLFTSLRRLLSVGKVFRGIPAEDLLDLCGDPDKLLYVMEVFEFSYCSSKRQVEKPLALLRKGLRSGVTPDKGFTRGWWMRSAEALERDIQAKRQAAAEQDAASAQAEANEKRIAALTERYNALPAEEQQRLRSRALDNLVAQGLNPEFSNPLMRYEIAALVEKLPPAPGGGNGSSPE